VVPVIKLDRGLLATLGLDSLPSSETGDFLAYMQETLELRVGRQLVEGFSEDQINEFKALAIADDSVGALEWLESNAPHYREVVSDQFERLCTEIRESVSSILQAKDQGDSATDFE
jgi:hypothetical protein